MDQYWVVLWITGRPERREGPFTLDIAKRVSRGLERNGWHTRLEKVK